MWLGLNVGAATVHDGALISCPLRAGVAAIHHDGNRHTVGFPSAMFTPLELPSVVPKGARLDCQAESRRSNRRRAFLCQIPQEAAAREIRLDRAQMKDPVHRVRHIPHRSEPTDLDNATRQRNHILSRR